MEVFASGKFKSIGTPGVALTEEQRELLHAEVAEIFGDFRAAVLARGRKIPDEAMEGQTFSARQAQRLNLSGMAKDRDAVLAQGSAVNLERAAAVNSRLGGHIVQGHVDGTGTVISRTPSAHWEVVRIALPGALSRYVVEKGSITVDGVSLTVSALGADEPLGGRAEGSEWFEVSLIPTTLGLTTLGSAAPGTPVNLEVDVIAKYVERLLSARGD
jgi:riboflavin synthase alpha subunit